MFDKLMENVALIQQGIGVLEKAQNLDADKNGVLDGEQHKQFFIEEMSLANALREKLDAHGKLVMLDLEALGVLPDLDGAAPASEVKAEAPVKSEKKGK